MSQREGGALWDYAFMGEVTIDRPVKEVWPYFFGSKKDIWTNAEYMTIEGVPDNVGEVYVMKKRPGHASDGAYLFYELIKLEPLRQIVLKITSAENEAAPRVLVGYDWVILKEIEGRTAFILQQVFTRPVEHQIDLNQEIIKQDGFLPEIMRNLKKLVEQNE